MRTLLTSFVLWIASSLSAFAATSVPVDTGKVVASLLSSHYSVTPGQSFDVALKTTLDEKWHTYWRNPGDSGEPVSIRWTLPGGVSASEITWPLPAPIDTGGIINYGFEGEPLFPVTLTVPENAVPGTVMEIVADVYYLVCKDICIPEDGQLSLAVQVADVAEPNPRNIAEIDGAIAAAPKPNNNVRGGLSPTETALTMEFTNLPDGEFSNAYFFPYEQDVVSHSEAQVARVVDAGLVIETVKGFGWADGITDTQTGVLAFDQNGQRVGQIITVEPNVSLGLAAGAGGAGGSVTQFGLLTALFGAFLGGLILNLMPCVFPVISLKALSLAKSAHAERVQARSEAWMYALGVVAMFAVLVAILLGLKAGGAALGWGFQLQNPVFIGMIALLLFAVGLNLIGAYEIAGGSYQNIGSEASMKGGRTGSFFTGALAVLVATPCTAPFMAGAIGYALAQPALITIVVFLALALGFAAPFVLLAYMPKLLSAFPKPGPWMITFRQLLAFPMFAAAIFFLPIQDGTISLLLWSALALAFGLWLLRFGRIWKVVSALIIAFAVLLPTSPYWLPKTENGVETIAWSPETVAALRAEGRAVFVDFTADWCVTCKVNERAVLKTEVVQQAFAETDTAFLIADWTYKDDRIANELASYGHAGVPLYLFYPAGDNSVRAEILPQLLTQDMVIARLKGTKTTS